MSDQEEVLNSQSDGEGIQSSLVVLNTKTKKGKHLPVKVNQLRSIAKQSNKILRNTRRVASFAQNHQFTVIAAEFLNLSTKSHLNKLYNNGYTLDQIENFLEKKYRKKQRFWLSSGVSHHRFKRKDFTTWTRLMNDASIFNSNTIFDEDQLSRELDEQSQMKINEINMTNIEDFTSDVESSSLEQDFESYSDTEISVKSNFIPNNEIPSDPSLIVLSSSDVNTLSNKALTLNDVTEVDIDSQIKLPSRSRTHHILEDSQVENNDNISDFQQPAPQISNVPAKSQDLILQDAVNEQQSQDGSQQELDRIFDEINNITTITPGTPLKHFKTNFSTFSSSPTPIPEEIDIETEPIQLPSFDTHPVRKLRHRNIVNRNPYMVDRAEYLGLSTPVELLDMAESGKTDDEIIEFLDEIYQKRRKQRKDNGYGYGPFSKKTFREIMEQPAGAEQKLLHDISMTAEDADFKQLPSTQGHDNEDNDDLDHDDYDFDTYALDGDDNTSELLNIEEASASSTSKLRKNATKPHIHIADGHLSVKNQGEAEDSVVSDPFLHSMEHIYNYMGIAAVEDTKSLINPMLQKSTKQFSKLSSKSSNSSNRHLEPIDVLDRMSYRSRKISSNQQSPSNSTTNSYHAFADPLLDLGFSDNEENVDKKEVSRKNMNVSLDHFKEKAKKADRINTFPALGRSSSTITSTTANFDGTNRRGTVSLGSKTISLPRSKSAMSMKQNRAHRFSDKDSSDSDTDKKHTHKRKKAKGNTVIAASYAPKSNPNFEFNREVSKGTFQAEGIASYFEKSRHHVVNNKMNFDAARGVDVTRQQRVGIANNENWKTMKKLWNRHQDELSISERRVKVLMDLKLEHFAEFELSSKLLTSNLISKILTLEDTYYYESNIIIELDKSGNIVFTPIKDTENVLTSLKDFFAFLGVALRGGKLSNQRVIQIRKSLINIIRLCWNLKRDLPILLVDVGLLMNEFLNTLRDHPPEPEAFCFFSPFFLVCMNLFQRFLGVHAPQYLTFQKSARWIQKKFILNFCQIPYQLFFIPENRIYFEALNLYLLFTKNVWDIVTQLGTKLKFVDVTCALYFFNQKEKIETDWAFYIQHLVHLESLKKENLSDSATDKQAKDLCIILIKLERDLGWEIEPQLLIRVFRLLSAHKFENVGSKRKHKASAYLQNEPSILFALPEDGCLDLYFKMLTIFSRNYIRTSTEYSLSFLETDLTPGSTLNGYNSIQLQNRAQAVLMLWIVFDKDVLAYLTNIVEAMIKEGSTYSLKSLMSLLKLVTTRISRRPILTLLKFLPNIVQNLNSLSLDGEVNFEFKELLGSIRNNLSSDEHLPIKHALQFMLHLIKLECTEPFEDSIQSIFEVIEKNWIFGIERATEKDTIKLKKLLDRFCNACRAKLLSRSITSTFRVELLRYWLFGRQKMGISAPKVYYQEWKNLGDEKVMERLELPFFCGIVFLDSAIDIRRDILLCFFKHLAIAKADIRQLLNGIMQLQLLAAGLSKFCNLSSVELQKRRTSLTIKALSSIVGSYNIDEQSNEIMALFICSIKTQYEIQFDDQYIKDVATYIYTVIGDQISIPEWKYLEAKLNLESVTGSLSKQIAYASDISTNRLITSIVKSYIASIINGELSNFTTDFKDLFTKTNSSEKLVRAVCTILSYHISSIQASENEYDWIHINFWMKIVLSMLEYSWLKLDFISILSILKESSKLSVYFAQANLCLYYYYDTVLTVYCMIRMLYGHLKGFKEAVLLSENFSQFSGVDPSIENELYFNEKMIEEEIEILLRKYFHDNSILLNGKYCLVQNQKVIFEMSEKVHKERKDTMNYLGL